MRLLRVYRFSEGFYGRAKTDLFDLVFIARCKEDGSLRRRCHACDSGRLVDCGQDMTDMLERH